MKPSTNFKIIVGIFLLLFCAGTLYLFVRDFNERSQRAVNPNVEENILKDNR